MDESVTYVVVTSYLDGSGTPTVDLCDSDEAIEILSGHIEPGMRIACYKIGTYDTRLLSGEAYPTLLGGE